ncbi:transcriptional regulator, TetR family [Burkholderia sp. YR290]|jgi:TetR/AcrR family transcriptional repressor of nem operon|uniref:TetR/AcrR family transcriptional regulator n=1 Tax=Paraburkholderia hospita TaxID=169430 RepID=UPI0009A710DC|nr:TetR/AcrR family transcriptional regulator [Paraburkholderia hospita]SKC99177.1 transcriptional regulator, TetR family [Paraburkholderia hospita]SOE89499.1 transcriptional regulator, TetR family [Burkholderia sp. YR290]
MGVSKQKAVENRKAIIAASEKLFREHGIDGVGLSALMKAAGFTQGGFYNHFESKEALAAEVVASAMEKANHDLKEAIAAPITRGGNRLKRQVDFYLSGTHCDDIEQGCAVAGLTADVRRLGTEAQSNFASGLETMIETLTALVAEQRDESVDTDEARREAIAFYSEMVGALILSRAVGGADPGLGEEILKSSRQTLLRNFALEGGQGKR